MNLDYSPEYRAERRYITELKAKLEHSLFKEDLLITNLSISGVQMKCSQALVSTLAAELGRSTPQAPLQVTIHMDIPTPTQKTCNLKLQCNLVYSRRLSRDRYLIGAQFNRLEDSDKQALVNYMEKFGKIL